MKLENVKVLAKGELRSGIGSNGEWRVQTYIIETAGDYPKKYEVEFINSRVESCAMEVGEVVNIEFDLASREYNGRFYYSLKGWKVERGDETLQAPSAQPVAEPVIPKMQTQSNLPF